MDKLNDLRDLLTHEIHDLLSAEDQIIEALPEMITKATNPALKSALKEHLRITGMQRKRLDQVNNLLSDEKKSQPGNNGISSFLAKLFGSGVHKCKGMEGIITEGKKILELEMNAEVLDAAIIACAQKIEHYEICGYGTAKAFAKELHLSNVWVLLQETLQEEYAADQLLTKLATGGVNEMAENAAPEHDNQELEADPRPKKAKTAASFYGTGKGGPKKANAEPQGTTRAPKKNVSPNRRQVPPKPFEGETKGKKNSGSKNSGSRGASKGAANDSRKGYGGGSSSRTTGGGRGGASKGQGKKSTGGRK